MADLKTKYMGLELDNPIVVASSSLTKNIHGILQARDAGAGAVVLKSIFEEQIAAQTDKVVGSSNIQFHAEAADYIREMSMSLGPHEYLELIEKAKKETNIPIIASLNCVSPEWWVDYARDLSASGADALELNISIMPSEAKRTSDEIEELYIEIAGKVAGEIDIPVAVKLGPYFTSLGKLATQLCKTGIDALVLFNRFYQIDIDIDKMELRPGYSFSSPEEYTLAMRWIALLKDKIDCNLAATTGIHDSTTAIKMLLAGADIVEIASIIYQNGWAEISKMVDGISRWMDKNDFASIEDFRGKMSQLNNQNPEEYLRQQYIQLFVGIE